ncbi:MAG TPA: MlaD family protein [Allosphingosinicella sp.]|jgi:phospholipid/cholesterol/gamma-HCH transport system substrate-binding protein|nr:MlaD family protein [Allosphingosinicella sp.]
METRSNQVLVGSITLGLLGALVLFVVWLSQISGAGEKKYDIFFQQSVEGLAKGTSVTFSGVPVGQIESINLVPDSPQFIRVRINVNGDTPVLEGSTATIRGVGFTGVSQIQIDPPPPPQAARTAGQQPRPRREIRCPEQNPQSECPYGVPVIPTRPGALTSLLNTAPELLERVSTLTERLTELLSDRNQESIAGILDNLQQISRSLAERSPEIAAALAEARVAIRQAGEAADRIGQLANSTTQLIDRDGRPLVNDLRQTMRSAQGSLAQLEAAIGDARPGLQAFSNQTLPEVGQLMRELRSTSESLREITDRLNQQGVGGVIGGQRLPNYRPGRRN